MEFKLKNVVSNGEVQIFAFHIGTNIAMKLMHNGKNYNTLFDDVMYVYGKVARVVSENDYIEMYKRRELCFNSVGVYLRVHMDWAYFGNDSSNNTGIARIQNQNYNADYYNQMYRLHAIHIREPEDPNEKMVIEKQVVKIEKEYVDREVIKLVDKIVVKEMDELEECFICSERKGYMSFGCCSFKQCTCKTGRCPQCRRGVTLSDMKHILE